MTNCTDDLLAVIKQQQEQITELLRQKGILIGKAGAGSSALTAATQAATKNEANAAAKIVASASAKANTAAIANATDSVAKPNPRATYTTAQKVEAKATVKRINAGTQESGGTQGVCILYGKHYVTTRCFEINVNAHL